MGFHSGVLRYGTAAQLLEIESRKARITVSNRGERPAERELAQYADGEQLECLERSDALCCAAFQLDVSEFLGDPCCDFLEPTGFRAHPFRDAREELPVRLNLTEERTREIFQRRAGVLVLKEFEEIDRQHRTRVMVVEVGCERLAHLLTGRKGMLFQPTDTPEVPIFPANVPPADFPIDESLIARRVTALGNDIGGAIPAPEPLILIGLLRACFVFVADLARAIPRPVEVEFVSARSYAGNQSTGTVVIDSVSASQIDVAGKHIMLVDTMLDHGLTLTAAAALFHNSEARSVSACVLLRKPHSPRRIVAREFIGFDVPDRYAVGYGLDSNGHYRNQRFISAIHA